MENEHKSRYELFLEEEARKAQPTKRCSRCKEVKALSEYRKNKNESQGVSSACKKCLTPPHKYKSYEDRFWKTFWPRTRQVGDCLEWVGTFSEKKPTVTWRKRRNTSLRRVMYQLTRGVVPDDMFVITTCNNIKCVKQSHMKLVSRDEFKAKLNNSAATADRNGSHTRPDRQVRGESHPHSRLNVQAVLRIRELRATGIPEPEIAHRIGVSRGAVNNVLRGETWKHVQ
jgi:hypothetical protein